MGKFAKLFEIGDDQVLLFMEYEDNTDETTVHQITTVDGIRVDIKFSFHGEKQEELAEKYISNFEQENAQALRKKIVEMFNE